MRRVPAEHPAGQIGLQAAHFVGLVRETIESYPEWQKPKAEIRVEGKLPTVLGNEAFLTQCITNLVGNAVKFVRIGQTPRVKIWAETSNGCARVCFEDNGIGIPAKDQQRIFGMFERLHNIGVYEGTGIGLAIVKRAMERMSGAVGVQIRSITVITSRTGIERLTVFGSSPTTFV